MPAAEAGPGAQNPGGGQAAASPVRPLTEGPLHEAFLSPRKDRLPLRIEKGPPAPLTERPAVDPPSPSAEWIEGYWEWDAGRKDFIWVTGTWRSSSARPFLGERLLEARRSGLVSRIGVLERAENRSA